MDTQRIFLFLIFSISSVLIWDAWQNHHNAEEANPSPAAIKSTSILDKSAKPDVITQLPISSSGKVITVQTDFLSAEINTIGGEIQKLSLLQHPDALEKTKSFVIFEKGRGSHNYSAQSGLLGTGLPNHNSPFMADRDDYQLSNTDEKIDIHLSYVTDSNIKVVKTITFHRASYLIDVAYNIENKSEKPIDTSAYYQLIRDGVEPAGGIRFVPTYTGAAIYTDKEKLQKVDFKEIGKDKSNYVKEADNGWVGVLQHYFVAAWIPKHNEQREFFTKQISDGLYAVGTIIQIKAIQPGSVISTSASLYAGPAKSNLDDIAPGLGLTVDYGMLTIIAKPMFWLMTQLHGWVNNWGIAIILLTLLIKLAFFPLSAASYRSMAKMRVVAPKLENIKKLYSDDREKLNRAMMELYKTEKINPLGGCLPVLIQIPVFIALYWSILESVELRYAPFFGWIQNLSVADPYYILPAIMGASMILQSKLNPAPPDPMQAKLMKIMPVMFSVVFFFFPAGLVLYSIVNNLLSIAQQWYITRSIESQGLGSKY